MKTRISFSDVKPKIIEVLKRHSIALADRSVVVVRDLDGRPRIAIKGKKSDTPPGFVGDLIESLGAYAPSERSALLYESDLAAPQLIWESPDRHPLCVIGGSETIYLIDRQVVGQDWLRQSLANARTRTSPRVVFHGIKGGVGRSTAMALTARALAKDGKRVLIVDLDLESPGVSVSLLRPEELPSAGVVDYLVETAVDADYKDDLVSRMVSRTSLDSGLAGQVRVVAAFGSNAHEYVPKLSRCYNESLKNGRPVGFAERIEEMLELIEAAEQPDITLIDSRAGIDEIAACTLARLGGTNLLFGTSGRQTWFAYELLFQHLALRQDRSEMIERTKVVAALVPETSSERYLNQFTERAYTAFANSLYFESQGGQTVEGSFDLGHEEAPHFPLRIDWSRTYMEFDPTDPSLNNDLLDEGRIELVYGRLIGYVKKLLGDVDGLVN
jgi:hypothetical protein